MNTLDDAGLDQLFRNARTQNGWQGRPVRVETLHAIWDLTKMGPTSANCLPARVVFVSSAGGKARLKPHLMDGNVDKTMAAPVTAIIGHDLAFYHHLPEFFPHADAKAWFEGNDALILETSVRNIVLQGAYLMIAARALGLDCGPMSCFAQDAVTSEFFPGTNVKANFLCHFGYVNNKDLFDRRPPPGLRSLFFGGVTALRCCHNLG